MSKQFKTWMADVVEASLRYHMAATEACPSCTLGGPQEECFCDSEEVLGARAHLFELCRKAQMFTEKAAPVVKDQWLAPMSLDELAALYDDSASLGRGGEYLP